MLLYMDSKKHNIKCMGCFFFSVATYIAQLSSSRHMIQNAQHNAISFQDIGDEFLKENSLCRQSLFPLCIEWGIKR